MHTRVKIHRIFWGSEHKEHVGKSECTGNSGKTQVLGNKKNNNKYMPNQVV